MKVIGINTDVCFDCKCEHFEFNEEYYVDMKKGLEDKDGLCKLLGKTCAEVTITHLYCPVPIGCKYRNIQITKWNGRIDICGNYESADENGVFEDTPEEYLTNKANCKCPFINYEIKVEYK